MFQTFNATCRHLSCNKSKCPFPEGHKHLVHVTCCHMVAPHTGEAAPLQAAAKVPQAQSRPGAAVKPWGVAGCSGAQASAACGSCALAVKAPAQPQATCISQVGDAVGLVEANGKLQSLHNNVALVVSISLFIHCVLPPSATSLCCTFVSCKVFVWGLL